MAVVATVSIAGSDDPFTLDETDVLVERATGLPQHSWIINPTVRNKIDLYYDFNEPGYVKDDFGRRQVYTADASVTRYGVEPSVKMLSRGIRTTIGGQAIMDALALGFMQRWGYPPPLLRLAVTYRRHTFQILDSIRLTHSKIRNPITGRAGITQERFEIIDVTPSWLTEGKLNLLLLWTGAVEKSAAPTSGGALALKPGIGTRDDSDVPVTFGGSASVTTAASTSKLNLTLKSQCYRHWECIFNVKISDGAKSPTCIDGGQSYVDRSYTDGLTYHIDYKTSGAPDSAGTGGDPTTGWVALKASTTRGAVALYDSKDCFGTAQTPGVPAQDIWTEGFPVLGGSPATYNIKVFFDSVSTQADPCSALGAAKCSDASVPCTGALASSALITDQKSMTIDAIESIT